MNKKPKNLLRICLCSLAILFSVACFVSARWYIAIFGDVGFDSILYTLLSDLSTTESTTVGNYLINALVPIILVSGFLIGLLFIRTKKPIISIKGVKIYPLSDKVSVVLSLVIAAALIANAAVTTRLVEYAVTRVQKSNLYETEYADPKDVKIEFSENKRNLIVIYLESMETTYFDKQNGGANEQNLIPELYSLAQENLNFSHNQGVGGFGVFQGTSFTTGAILSSTSGVPLKVKLALGSNGYSTDETFLPNLETLMEVLNEEGYYQTFMVGSAAEFGGRKQYLESHGIDKIYDHSTAVTDGIIPEGYHVWWGMEDYYLFEYAKKQLTEISKREEPFAFSMLTVDTHHIGGYICEKCKTDHAEQYENAISCSSRQAAEMVEWIKEQDFFENTTVIVTGDHLSMDGGYISRNVPSDYQRHVYNCFINSAITTDNTKNRVYAAIDLFPTILASMGCKIEGDRLGLGTNLFSDRPTLLEEFGADAFKKEIQKSSTYYNENFY
ncbi:MAG: LTA synthase family protein [Clostridia bacterium]|nr:LTA synthase family protein [Clostridia bacterium]